MSADEYEGFKKHRLAMQRANNTIFHDTIKELNINFIPYKRLGKTFTLNINDIMYFDTLAFSFRFKGREKVYRVYSRKNAIDFIKRILNDK